MNTDLWRVAECLLTAHYTEAEIIDYLERCFGLTIDEAVSAVRDAAGPRDHNPPESMSK